MNMKRTSKKIGLAAVAALATLAATGCTTMCGDHHHEGTVKCAGANHCKGSSSCNTPDNSCKGKNSCRGSGWTYMTKSECHSRGGHVVD